MSNDTTSPLDLVVDALVALLPQGLTAVGAPPGAIALVVTPWLTPLGVWAKARLRDRLAEQLPTLRVPESVSLEAELQAEIDRLRPPTIPAPPPTERDVDASDPTNSLLTPPEST